MSATPYVLGGLAAVFGLRALFRPHHAIVREGAAIRCPGGSPCNPTLGLEAPSGSAVFSVASGHVVLASASDPGVIHIAARGEPVILYYAGVRPEVQEGQYVGRGQTIGHTPGRVSFGVMEFGPGGTSDNVDPTSWLASRGQRIAARYTGPGNTWCEEVRHVSVPREAGAACALKEPDRTRFALLPVSVEIAR